MSIVGEIKLTRGNIEEAIIPGCSFLRRVARKIRIDEDYYEKVVDAYREEVSESLCAAIEVLVAEFNSRKEDSNE